MKARYRWPLVGLASLVGLLVALHLALPSIRCVGYRQAWESLDGLHPMDTLRERGIAATRQLAKRQITWLRSMPGRHAIACDAPDAQQHLLQAALAVVDAIARQH